MEDSSKRTDNQTYTRSQQLIYIVIIITPLAYLLILLVLHVIDLDEMIIPESLFSNSLFNTLLVVFIIASIIQIIVAYKIFIPLAMWEGNVARRSNWNLIFLSLGDAAINVYGLILGILWWTDYNFIPFYIVIPFLVVGSIHGLYLYYRYILNYDARKKEMDEKYRSSGKSIMISKPLDPSQDIFTPILTHLNTNENIMMYYIPKIGKILIVGTLAIVSFVFFSFITFYLLNSYYSDNSGRMFIINFMFFGLGIFSLTILPILLIVKVIILKRTMYVFTSDKIILKYPRKIKIIGFDAIISFKKFREGLFFRDIQIVFKNKSGEDPNKEEEIHIDVPREFQLLEKLKILKKGYLKTNENE